MVANKRRNQLVEPCKSEIRQLPGIYRWALPLDYGALKNGVDALPHILSIIIIIIAIGSGGSQST